MTNSKKLYQCTKTILRTAKAIQKETDEKALTFLHSVQDVSLAEFLTTIQRMNEQK